jgi:hypothetical protein
MRGRVIYTDTIVSVWLRLAKNNGLDEEVYGMIANGGDDGDVSRHSSPSFGICDSLVATLRINGQYGKIHSL